MAQTSNVTVSLTPKEAHTLKLCLSGELENDDGLHDDYFVTLRRIARKLDKAK